MFDMKQCKPGDALETRGGEVVYYVGPREYPMYPHEIMYSDGSRGTMTDDGLKSRIHTNDMQDIVGRSAFPWRLLSLIEPADGQSVFLRIEKPDGPRYKCATAPIRRRSTDGVFWMEVPE